MQLFLDSGILPTGLSRYKGDTDSMTAIRNSLNRLSNDVGTVSSDELERLAYVLSSDKVYDRITAASTEFYEQLLEPMEAPVNPEIKSDPTDSYINLETSVVNPLTIMAFYGELDGVNEFSGLGDEFSSQGFYHVYGFGATTAKNGELPLWTEFVSNLENSPAVLYYFSALARGSSYGLTVDLHKTLTNLNSRDVYQLSDQLFGEDLLVSEYMFESLRMVMYAAISYNSELTNFIANALVKLYDYPEFHELGWPLLELACEKGTSSDMKAAAEFVINEDDPRILSFGYHIIDRIASVASLDGRILPRALLVLNEADNQQGFTEQIMRANAGDIESIIRSNL